MIKKLFRKHKEDNWKIIEKVNKMSDEEIIIYKKKLYIQSGILMISGLLMFIGVIVLIVLITPYL